MNKSKKIILAVLAIVLIGAATALYLWNKPHRTADDEKPFASLTASDLYKEFVENDSIAFAKYKEKVIQVNGIVKETKTDASGNVDILLETGDEMSSIVCTLMKGATAEGINTGKDIALKGICNGALKEDLLMSTDVLLNQGVVVKEKN